MQKSPLSRLPAAPHSQKGQYMKHIELEREQKLKILRIAAAAVLTAAAVLLSMYLSDLGKAWLIVMYLIPYLIVGYDIIIETVTDLVREHEIGECFLMTAATIGAFCLSEYGEAVAVMLLYQVGELFGDIATDSSRRSIKALLDIRPDTATVLRGGEEITVSPEDVAAGEIIVVRPGERIALDGEIVSGASALDTSALTGESVPVSVGVGDKAVSGAVSLSGVLQIKTSGTFGQSTVAQILDLAENAAEKKAHTEAFVTRFARVYTPVVVTAAVLLAVLPPLIFNAEWSVWIERALVFLVISCPCALVVSVPLSFFGGLGGASREGVLIKGSNYMESLASADTVVFDKTGTLTEGTFSVTEAAPAGGVTKDELLRTAALAESFSTHPIATSIVSAASGALAAAVKPSVTDVREEAGHGVSARIDGCLVLVGNRELMEAHGIALPEAEYASAGTVVYVSQNGKCIGSLTISDEIKPDAAGAVADLKALGIKRILMLTGDSEQTAREVGRELGIDEVHAQLMPADKVAIVEDLIKEGRRVVFVGDGINDAPVLTRADVGVAMGCLGSDAAIQSADVVLMDDRTSKLPLAVARSRRTCGIAKQNIVISIAVKLIVMALGALGLTNMWLATLADVGVMILAVLNAMRALGGVKPQKHAAAAPRVVVTR